MFAGWELRNLITERFSDARIDLHIHQHLYGKLSNKSITVVSLNYDLMAEKALPPDSWFYARIDPRGEDAVNVLKPHGSVNWIHEIPLDGGTDKIFRSEIRPTGGFGFADRLFRQPSIVGLVRAKREFGPNEESFAVRYIYGGILHDLGDVIAKATHILVVGCSFAPGDQHIQAVLSSSRQTRNAGLPLKVGYIGKAKKDELEEEKKRWEARLQRIFRPRQVDVNLGGFCQDSINEVTDKMCS